MISNKILTILNVIIFLSYCRANGDLNEEKFNKNEKMMKNKLGEETQKALQPHRETRNQFKEMTEHQWEGMNKVWLDDLLIVAVTKHLAEERNKDDTFKKMTKEEWEDQVQVYVQLNVSFIKISYNNQIYYTTIAFLLTLNLSNYIKFFKKLNRYENVKIAYNELGWNENMSEEQMNYFIGHLPSNYFVQ
ncbi:hypothetical protein AGLY_017774 [Aphis glycines]|uniref:Cathepsin propeptide inhibitor domain-containing protein n=1 Tax=Aphis glycines TaxID=307491 RepID=A0A6G0SU53_APHGL|nr:hypothetical protein AGLY_017774 [Aphis glycines]